MRFDPENVGILQKQQWNRILKDRGVAVLNTSAWLQEVIVTPLKHNYYQPLRWGKDEARRWRSEEECGAIRWIIHVWSRRFIRPSGSRFVVISLLAQATQQAQYIAFLKKHSVFNQFWIKILILFWLLWNSFYNILRALGNIVEWLQHYSSFSALLVKKWFFFMSHWDSLKGNPTLQTKRL